VVLLLTYWHRIRKVKCDETWPVCRRCSSTSRDCGGYGVWGGGGQVTDSLIEPTKELVNEPQSLPFGGNNNSIKCLPIILLDNAEQGCLQWYMGRSAVKLPGIFASDFWTMLLLQASATEPAVLHAVLSLASAHREEVRGAGFLAYERNDAEAVFTVRQYSKAITSLQPSLSRPARISMRVTLITCALFVNMELLRGHYAKALVHLRHGLSLLDNAGCNEEDQQQWSTHADGWIITLFTRILVQSKLLGQNLPIPSSILVSSCSELNRDRFRSIHHARRTLEHIMLRSLCIQGQSERLTTIKAVKNRTMLRACQSRLQDDLQLWIRAHATTMMNLPTTHHSPEHLAYRLLQMYWSMANILISICVDPSNQMLYDNHEADFLAMLSHCIELYEFTRPAASSRGQQPTVTPSPLLQTRSQILAGFRHYTSLHTNAATVGSGTKH